MLKKIRVDQVRLGMHLQSLCGAWLEHPFWKTQFILSDPADLHKLRSSGVQECWIDAAKGLDVAESRPAGAAPLRAGHRADSAAYGPGLSSPPPGGDDAVAQRPPPVPDSFAAEAQRAGELVGQAKQLVTSLFAEARMGKTPDVSGCADLVNEVTSSVWRHPDAMLSLARLKTHDDYTYMHSVAVCALMVALARQMNLGFDAAREAGMAGLLHDMGKVAMPLDVLSKPGKLTDDEFALMRSHPERGHAMLLAKVVEVDRSLGDVTDGVLDVCLHHHERVDGKGYPHGLTGDRISRLAKMGAVCDVYDAITSNRPYKAAWDPSESIGKMASWRNGHFDDEIFQAFVRSMGIYPIGSLVRMESERLAVVIEQSPAAITRPKVKVFFSARTRLPIRLEVLDLSDPACTDRISGRESNKVWNFPHLESLWASADLLRKMGRG
ncbi:HD-GYP domain-containing protein [Piscinibacter sakaiensis]|uniref:HD-GYP domain-containing protein n=1 Tax=Piscinibacter sakaiensis TaxID=1547922 RepID=UPI003AADF878